MYFSDIGQCQNSEITDRQLFLRIVWNVLTYGPFESRTFFPAVAKIVTWKVTQNEQVVENLLILYLFFFLIFYRLNSRTLLRHPYPSWDFANVSDILFWAFHPVSSKICYLSLFFFYLSPICLNWSKFRTISALYHCRDRLFIMTCC